MSKQMWVTLALCASFVAGIAYAQYPIMDKIADKVVQKYQGMTCEQLWQQKGQPKSEEEQRVIGFLKSDPQMLRRSSTRFRRPSSTRCSNAG